MTALWCIWEMVQNQQMSEDNSVLEQYISVPKGQTSENIQINMHLAKKNYIFLWLNMFCK